MNNNKNVAIGFLVLIVVVVGGLAIYGWNKGMAPYAQVSTTAPGSAAPATPAAPAATADAPIVRTDTTVTASNSTAVVTGATRGIGRSIADLFADEGANVAICARNADQVAETFRAIGGFSKVEVQEFGFRTGDFRVELWNINPKSGNRNLETVREPVTAKEAALIARKAKGKATDRDKAALVRISAERENA